MSNYFSDLNTIDVNKHTDKKGKFTYLSWAFAWGELKKRYPSAKFTVERFGDKPYLENELGYMVFTTVTVDDVTHEMWLPVMNYRNQAIQKGQADMMDINKTIMRCLVKNIGMHGLGLYLYAGEDLPEKTDGTNKPKKTNKPKVSNDNKKYQGMVTEYFNELVQEVGSNEKVYENLGIDRAEFVDRFTKKPQELFEFMQENT